MIVSAKPVISVITPSYNQDAFLEETLCSVLDQRYPNLEYIVIDGGSTDSSPNIIQRYSKHLSYWESEFDRGQSHALNKGLQRATGDVLCWINSDDLLMPGALEFAAEHFSAQSDAAWVIGSANIIGANGRVSKIRSPGYINESIFFRWTADWFPQQATFWNRAMWEQVTSVREDLHYVMDLALWYRMFQVSEPSTSEVVLASYRMHKDAKCVGQPENAKLEQRELHKEWLQNKWQQEGGNELVLESVRTAIDELIDAYLESCESCAESDAQLARIKGHPVFGPAIKFWRQFVNSRFML